MILRLWFSLCNAGPKAITDKKWVGPVKTIGNLETDEEDQNNYSGQ